MAEQEAQEQWRTSINVDGEVVIEQGADRFLVRLEPRRLVAYLNKAQQEVRELRAEVEAVLSNLSNYERERPDVQALLKKADTSRPVTPEQ